MQARASTTFDSVAAAYFQLVHVLVHVHVHVLVLATQLLLSPHEISNAKTYGGTSPEGWSSGPCY